MFLQIFFNQPTNHRYVKMSKEWYVIMYKQNSHLKAVKNLNQQGFETFLPLYHYTIKHKSTFKNITRPLFPGYMFVKFDRESSHSSKINSTYGVSKLLIFEKSFKAVPEVLIDELRKRCNHSRFSIANNVLKEGDQVKVLVGPFSNFIATVEKLCPDQRISVLTDLLGRKTKVETNLADIQPSN